MKKLLCGTTVALALASQPAFAVIPVEDATLNATTSAGFISSLKNQIEQLANLATQISQLANLVSLATVASTVLGDTVNPEVGQLFSDMQNLYSQSWNAYGGIMRAPERIQSQLSLFEPPDNMTFMQLMERAKQIRALTLGTQNSILANQATAMEHRAYVEQLASRANGMNDRAVSALSATQAVGEQLRVMNKEVQFLEEASANTADAIANKMAQEGAERDAAQRTLALDSAARKQQLSGNYQSFDRNPLQWGF